MAALSTHSPAVLCSLSSFCPSGSTSWSGIAGGVSEVQSKVGIEGRVGDESDSANTRYGMV